MNWMETIKQLAPTVASALAGPLAGQAVSAIGAAFEIGQPTQEKIQNAIETGGLSADHIAEIRRLELQYQESEKERGFKYSELEFKDRDSARNANVSGGIQKHLLAVSVILLVISIGAECVVLFYGYPEKVPDIVVGRVLGLLDSVAMLVLSYYYGTSHGSSVKTDQLAVK